MVTPCVTQYPPLASADCNRSAEQTAAQRNPQRVCCTGFRRYRCATRPVKAALAVPLCQGRALQRFQWCAAGVYRIANGALVGVRFYYQPPGGVRQVNDHAGFPDRDPRNAGAALRQLAALPNGADPAAIGNVSVAR